MCDDEDLCAICWHNQANTFTQCRHGMCAECADRLFTIDHRCPVCRQPILFYTPPLLHGFGDKDDIYSIRRMCIKRTFGLTFATKESNVIISQRARRDKKDGICSEAVVVGIDDLPVKNLEILMKMLEARDEATLRTRRRTQGKRSALAFIKSFLPNVF